MTVLADFSRAKFAPYDHQRLDVQLLLDNPRFALWNDPGTGKTKTVVDTACLLFEAREIDWVLVVSPAQVCSVWDDPKLGEVVTHCWVPYGVLRYNARNEDKLTHKLQTGQLNFVVCSYEFLRQEDLRGDYLKVEGLLEFFKDKKFWLVCDETTVLSNHKSATYKSILRLRNG